MYAMPFKPLSKILKIPTVSVIEDSKWHQLQVFLGNPTLKPATPTKSRLKHRAITEFELINNKLYRRSDNRFPTARCVVPESEAFDTIANGHLQTVRIMSLVPLVFGSIRRSWVNVLAIAS